MSVRQWFLIVVLGLTIPLVLFSGVLAVHVTQLEASAARERLRGDVMRLADRIDNRLQSSVQEVLTIAASQRLQSGNLDDFIRLTVPMIKGLGASIVVLEETGRALASSSDRFDLAEPPLWTVEQVARVFQTGRPFVSSIVRDVAGGRDRVFALVPTSAKPAGSRLALAAIYDARTIAGLIDAASLRAPATRDLFDQQGRSFVRPSDPPRGVPTTPAIPRTDDDGADWPMTPSVIDGVEMLSMSAPLSVAGWAANLSVARSALQAPLREVMAIVALGAVLALAVCGGCALFAAHRIVRPIGSLVVAARALGAGKLPRSSGPLGIGELERVRAELVLAYDLRNWREEERAAIERKRQEDEKRHREILDAAGVGTFSNDLLTDRREWDGNFQRLFGFVADERVTYSQLHNRIHPDDPPPLREVLYGQKADGTFSVDFRVVWGDGSLHFLRLRGRVERGETGATIRLRGVCFNVDAVKQAEHQLRASEARHRTLFEQASVAVLYVALDGRIIDANERACSLLGRPIEELRGLSTSEITHPEDLEWSTARFRALAAGAKETYHEKRYLRADGSTVYMGGTGVAVFDDAGRPQGVIGIGVDITQRKLAEEAARASETRYRTLFDNASVMVLQGDLDGRIIDANEKFCQSVGRSLDDLRGVRTVDITHPDDRAATLDRLSQLAAGEKYDYAEKRYLRADGSSIWLAGTVSAVLDATGKPESLISIGVDVSARKAAEEALRASEARLRTLFDQAVVAVLETDPDGTIIDANGYLCEMVGRPIDELRGMNAADLLPEEDRAQSLERIGRLARTGKPFYGEKRYLRPDGSILWTAGTGTALFDANGKPERLISIGVDITPRKLAEDALRASEERFRTIVSQAAVGIVQVDMRGRIQLANDAYGRIVGRTAQALRGMGLWEITDPEHWRQDRQRRQRLLATGNDDAVEKRYVRPDGTIVWGSTDATLLRDDNGAPVAMLAFCIDITARKQAEASLSAREVEFGTLFRQASVGIVQTDGAGRVVRANERFCHMVGRSEAELLGASPLDITHPENLPFCRPKLEGILQNGQPLASETRLLRPDGSAVPVSVNLSTINDSSGAVVGLMGVYVDISQRKEAEAALRAREIEFGTLFEQASVGILQGAPDGKFARINQRLCDILGRAEGDLIGRNPVDFVHPDDVQRCVRLFDEMIRTGRPTASEKRFLRPDGSIVWVGVSLTTIVDAEGSLIGVMGVYADITQRKATEAALTEREAQFGAIFRQASVGIIQTDMNSRVMRVNEQFCDIVGRPESQLVELSPFDLIHPDDVETCRSKVVGVIATGVPAASETRYLRPDGTPIWVSVDIALLQDGNGRDIGLLGVYVDITARKKAEEEQRASESRFRTLVRQASIGIVQGDFAGRIEVVNDRFCQMVGRTSEDLIGRTVAEITHPDDRDETILGVAALGRGGPENSIEKRYQRPDGSSLWVRVMRSVLRDDEGRPVSQMGIVEDITARRKAEQDLRESEERFRALVRQASVGIIQSGMDARIEFMNDRACQILGCTADDFVGRTAWDNIHPDDRASAMASFRRIVQSGEEQAMVRRYVRPDGSVRWTWATRSVLYGAAGEPARIMTVLDDVTDRRANEEALRVSEERFRTLVRQASVGIAQGDLQGCVEIINERACEILGRPAEDMIGRTAWDTVHPDDAAAAIASYWRVVHTGVEESVDRRYVHADGSVRWAHVTRSLLRDKSGAPYRVLTVIDDITDRRASEEALRVSEERFRSIFDQSSAGIFEVGEDGRIILANATFCRMLGRQAAELAGTHFLDITVAEDVEISRQSFDRVFAAGGGGPFEKRYQRADGSAVWVSLSGRVMTAVDGGTKRFVVVCLDITDRRRADEERRASEVRFRTLFDQAAVGIKQCDLDGRILLVNDRFCQLVGHSRDELATLTTVDIAPAEDRDAARERLRAVIETGQEISFEKSFLHADGSIVTAATTLSPLRDADGHLIGIMSVSIDITGGKRAEADQRATELRFRTLFNQAGVGIVHSDLDGHFLLVNDKFCEMVGRSRAELTGLRTLDISPTEDHEPARARIRRLVETGRELTYDKSYIHADGSLVLVTNTISLLRDAAGRPDSIIAVTVDVTAKKRAEEELRSSESKFRALFNQSAVGTLQTALDGRILLANDRFCQMIGRTPAELMRLTSFDISLPSDREHSLSRMTRLRDFGETITYEKCYVHADGSIIHVANTISPLRDAVGQPESLICVSIDITARRRAEEDLRTREAQFSSLFRQASVGISQVDVDGHYILVNDRFCELVARSVADLSHRTLFDITHPDDLAGAQERFRQMISTGRGYTTEKRYLRPDGTTIWVSISPSVLFDDDGRAASVMTVCIDVTERKRMEAERARLEGELRQSQKMEVLGQLTGGIAHDFNNLLLAIQLSLDDIGSEAVDQTQIKPILDVAQTATEQAQALTRQLLAFGRRQTLHPSIVNANEVLTGMAVMLQRILPANIAIKTILAASLPSTSVDRNQLENAIFNLAINARDAMTEGGTIILETGTVSIDPAAATSELMPGNYVTIAVHDTGVGMSAAVVQRAFEPFFTTKALGKGTGLGLSQVYGFITQSGGGIRIESAEHEGTTVFLYLPSHGGKETARVRRVARTTKAVGGNETILVVEDNPVVCGAVVRMLTSLGYEVCVTKSGDEALKVLQSDTKLDLLFSDVMLPGALNGIHLVGESRRLRPGLPVLVTTGYADSSLPSVGDIDAIPMLPKPYQKGDLARKLREVLEAAPVGAKTR